MISIATVLYTVSRLLQIGADACAVVAGVCEHTLGNPSVPEEILVAIALWIVGFRRITILWVLIFWCHVDASVVYVLRHSGNFTAVLSR